MLTDICFQMVDTGNCGAAQFCKLCSLDCISRGGQEGEISVLFGLSLIQPLTGRRLLRRVRGGAGPDPHRELRRRGAHLLDRHLPDRVPGSEDRGQDRSLPHRRGRSPLLPQYLPGTEPAHFQGVSVLDGCDRTGDHWRGLSLHIRSPHQDIPALVPRQAEDHGHQSPGHELPSGDSPWSGGHPSPCPATFRHSLHEHWVLRSRLDRSHPWDHPGQEQLATHPSQCQWGAERDGRKWEYEKVSKTKRSKGCGYKVEVWVPCEPTTVSPHVWPQFYSTQRTSLVGQSIKTCRLTFQLIISQSSHDWSVQWRKVIQSVRELLYDV